MADSVALMRAGTTTGKLADSMKAAWNERLKLRPDSTNTQAWDLVLRAQIDEVFLVLAHLGEAILPLGVFDKDFYLQTLGDVKASISSCGNDMLSIAWEELDAELQYCCCAGLTICAHFSPLPVYRGFGACVLSDWDWGCPDMAYLEEKARKKAIRTVYGVKQKTDPQPTRSIFQEFDQVIQILQVKPMGFFVKRPQLSGFAEQPRFGTRAKKEVKGELDLLEDWVHQLVRRGHPMPKGQQTTSWAFPFATWTSESNCRSLKSEKDCEILMLNQMDPGRLLHAFVCRRAANLDEHSMFLLLPRSAAESILGWLEGLPGMNHQIIKWDDLDTDTFERKISKSLRKKIGQPPIPVRYAIKHPDAVRGTGPLASESSPAILEHPNTVSPPPYSPTNAPGEEALAEAPEQPARAATLAAVELSAPETQELSAAPAESPTQPPQDMIKERASVPGLKSIHTLRRKVGNPEQGTVAATAADATTATRHPTVLRPGGLKARTSSNWMIEEGPRKVETAGEPVAVEMPAETVVPPRKPVPSVAVQPPAECAELPVPTAGGQNVGAIVHGPEADADKPDPLVIDKPSPGYASSDKPSPGNASSDKPPDTAAPAAAGNEYLELLNKVARGEISPQALAEMLQNGSVGASTPGNRSSEAAPSAATQVHSEPGKSSPEQTRTKRSYTLPYPESPVEAKQP